MSPRTSPAPTPLHRALRRSALASLATCGLAIALPLVTARPLVCVWDDALMFVRYADVLATTGRPTWNPGGPPTFGLTSIAQLMLVLPLRGVGLSAPLAMALASALATVGLLVALGVTTRRQPLAAAAALGALASTTSRWLPHALSGMDAMLATLLCFGFFRALRARLADAQADATREGGTAPTAWLRLGLAAGLVAWGRPDLLLLTLGALGLLSWPRIARSDGVARGARTALFAGLGVVAGSAALARVVFASALPLPWFAKVATLYDGIGRARFLRWSVGNAWAFFATALPLLAMIAFALWSGARRRARGSTPSPFVAVTLAIGAAFVAFETFVPLPIMGYHGRFQLPALGALLGVAIELAPRLSPLARRCRARAPTIVWSLALALPAVIGCFRIRHEIGAFVRAPGRPDTSLASLYADGWSRYWPAFDVIAPRLADAPTLKIAATDVGLLGVWLPRATIIDLAGLHDARFSRERLDVGRLDAMLDGDRPDLVYLPHPAYTGMHRVFAASERYRSSYRVFGGASLGAHADAAVRLDSPYFSVLSDALERKAAALGRAAAER